jgi:hypothetical protein
MDWANPNLLQTLFKKIMDAHDTSSMEPWYNTHQDVFREHSGLLSWSFRSFVQKRDSHCLFRSPVLRPYEDSLAKALRAAFPHHQFLPWKFPVTPSGFWSSLDNQKWFFTWLAKDILQFPPSNLDRWYSVSATTVKRHGGSGLLRRYYNGSHIAALKSVFPEHNWLDWRFESVPRSWWNDISHQRQFFDWLGKEVLKIERMDEWYTKISAKELRANGGATILRKYGGSPGAALAAAYPEHKWSTWRFQQVPAGYWDTVTTDQLHEIIAEVAKELSISQMEHWYRVSMAQLKAIGAISIIQVCHSCVVSLSARSPLNASDSSGTEIRRLAIAA